MDDLSFFLKNYRTRSSDDVFNRKSITHLQMDGGVCCIPDGMMDSFRKHYIDAFSNGKSLSFSEVRSEEFPMYFDLDIFQETKFQMPEIKVFLKAVVHVCNLLYNDLDQDKFRFIVSHRDPSQKMNDHYRKMWYKSGVHVVMYDFVVSTTEATTIVFRLLEYLEKHCEKNQKLSTRWEDVLDTGVYRSLGGLRMNFSKKVIRCKSCKNRKTGSKCLVCNGQIVYDDKTYRIQGIFKYDSEGGELIQDSRALQVAQKLPRVELQLTSLRARNQDLAPLAWYRSFKEDQAIKINLENNVPSAKYREIKSTGVKKAIEQKIRELHPAYKHVHVSKISFTKAEKKCTVYLYPGPNYRFCQNKGGEHLSNNIYFEITNTKSSEKCLIRQRCHCTCNVERSRGKCSTYRSAAKDLGDTIRKQLFYPGGEYMEDNNDILSEMVKTPSLFPNRIKRLQLLDNKRKNLDMMIENNESSKYNKIKHNKKNKKQKRG